jgi:hypothetical protein
VRLYHSGLSHQLGLGVRPALQLIQTYSLAPAGRGEGEGR